MSHRRIVAGWFGLVAAFAAVGCGDDASGPAPDTARPPAPDGGPTDPPSDAGNATSPGTGCTSGLSVRSDDGVTCGDNSCGPGNLCCMNVDGVCRAEADGCRAGDKELGCASSNGMRCKNGAICCLNATSAALASLKTSATCPAQLRFADFSLTSCLSVCNDKKLPVCQADAECAGGATCHAVLLVQAFAPITLGVCY